MEVEDKAKIFLEYRKEAIQFVRHYEDIRVKFSQLSITLTAALVGIDRFVASGPNRGLIPALIIFLGVCGVLVTLKYTELADRHATIARQMSESLSKMMSEKDGRWDLSLNYQEAARKHKERTGLIQLVRARYFWLLLHLGVLLLGVVILARQ